jgi:hypothetical protein
MEPVVIVGAVAVAGALLGALVPRMRRPEATRAPAAIEQAVVIKETLAHPEPIDTLDAEERARRPTIDEEAVEEAGNDEALLETVDEEVVERALERVLKREFPELDEEELVVSNLLVIRLHGQRVLLTHKEYQALAPALEPDTPPSFLVRLKPYAIIGGSLIAVAMAFYLLFGDHFDKDQRAPGVSLITGVVGLWIGLKGSE